MKTLVIAEAGSTWQVGKRTRWRDYAEKAIHVAAKCGADAVKFQWCSNPGAMEKRRSVMPGTYEHLSWPNAWLAGFAGVTEADGLEFMCTVFLEQDIQTVAPLVTRFKVASLEALDTAFIDAHLPYKKPILVSTGGLDMDQVKQLCDGPDSWSQVRYLQCTASYPAPAHAMNLGTIPFGINEGFFATGLSDHSGDVLTGALAVAAGATIVEVHFRLDETRKDNPDYQHSHAPDRLAQYIANLRKAETMMGDGVKRIEPCEEPMVKHRVLS